MKNLHRLILISTILLSGALLQLTAQTKPLSSAQIDSLYITVEQHKELKRNAAIIQKAAEQFYNVSMSSLNAAESANEENKKLSEKIEKLNKDFVSESVKLEKQKTQKTRLFIAGLVTGLIGGLLL